MTGESEPKPSIEERALVKLGYEHCLDTPLEEGVPIVGRRFLDAYGDSPIRQHTEDELYYFLDLSETDPDFARMQARLTRVIETYYGPPQPK